MTTNTVLALLMLALTLATLQASAADSAAGQKKYVLCAGCHGPTGAGNEALKYPRLAGRDAAYVAAQLRAFKSGGRDNATMKAMVAGLTEQDIDNLAAYIATFK
jgi:cytochrome c553